MKELNQTVNDIRRLRAMRKGWETIFFESKPGSERDTAFNMIQVLDDTIFSYIDSEIKVSLERLALKED